jgi:nicotinate phosphoribosyltransferase
MGLGLETDLYQLTMAAGYWHAGVLGSATFELFVRRLPAGRSYLIAAGIEQAVDHLERVAFAPEDRAWLKALPQFAHVPPAFFDEYLASFRFSGDVWAVREGTPVFAGEPILRVTAPAAEAQVVETALLALVGFQTSVASKAARLVLAAKGRGIVEFGARRAHGLGAALDAARAAYVGGAQGTSFVSAAERYGIPVYGTMAHSWVQAFPGESEAFRRFAGLFAESAVYLLDTYDTLAAARRLAASGLQPKVVRLDSGDLLALSRSVRQILNDAGLGGTRIFVTGDLDEHQIALLLAEGAPIDGFGVGTALSSVTDAPALPVVYKLVAIERSGHSTGVMKLSPGKATLPGPKQVWRFMDGGTIVRDLIAADDETPPAGGVPLLVQAMHNGQRHGEREPLDAIRDRCRAALTTLPAGLQALEPAEGLPVTISAELRARGRRASDAIERA